jgi:hypothetical protein
MHGTARAPASLIFTLNAIKTYTEMKYIFTHFLTTKINIFGQFHTPASLLPRKTPFIRKSMSLEDVANCVF